MAVTNQLTLEELAKVVEEYVDSNAIANTSFKETRDNVAGLLDKIGLITTIDTTFMDPLSFMNGNDLPLGRIIEEYFEDLILPTEYDPEGEGALKWYKPTYRPVTYNYSLGRKKISISIKNNDIERAVNNATELGSIVAIQYKRMTDSKTTFEYQLKRELLGRVVDLIEDAYQGDQVITYSTGSALSEGDTYYTITGTGSTELAVCVKAAESTSSWEQAKEDGYLVVLTMIDTISAPTDRETGNAFIERVKEVAEIAKDVSEGNSLNGNTIGAAEGLVLLVKQGTLPPLQVYTLAQTFNKDELSTGVRTAVIKDFGKTADDGVFAVLLDSRAIKLHKTYDVVRENFNGDGDFLNLFNHLEYTGYASRNAYIHVFTTSSINHVDPISTYASIEDNKADAGDAGTDVKADNDVKGTDTKA